MTKQLILPNGPNAARVIYDNYAAMLYGYIFEVVKDREIAEQYLMSVFNELPAHLHDLVLPGVNVYHRLLLLARKMMADFFSTIPSCLTHTDPNLLPAKPNRFLQQMTAEQQLIFCNIHYNGKSVSALASELNKTEQEIKTTLQQAFAAIRRGA